MSQRNFVKDQLHTEHGPLFLLCSFHPFIFFSFFWKICVCSAQVDTPLDPRFSFPLLCFLSLHIFSAFFPFLFVAVHWIFSSVAFSREILLMFIAGSTHAESNASTGRPVNCPMKINMVFFFCRNLSNPNSNMYSQKRGEYASAYGAELRSVFLPSFAVPSPRFARPLSYDDEEFQGKHWKSHKKLCDIISEDPMNTIAIGTWHNRRHHRCVLRS